LLNRGRGHGAFKESQVTREKVVSMMAGGEDFSHEDFSHELDEFPRGGEALASDRDALKVDEAGTAAR
jgi:hypothetical protein